MLRPMRPRWFLVPLLPLAALALFLALRPEPPAPAPLEQPPQEAPSPSQSRTPVGETLETSAAGEPTRSAESSASAASDEEIDSFGGGKIVSEIDADSAPVVLQGTLRDENTHLALPEFRLEFEVVGDGQGSQRRTHAVTDAQGHFRCEEPLLVARSLVRFVDRAGHKRVPPPWTLELATVRKGQLELSIPWGPTYAVAAAPREVDLSAVEVRLCASDTRNKGKNDYTSEWEPVHAGEKPWVRFAPIRGADRVERLEARSKDGLWWGRAEARTASGLAPGVTMLVFEERAVLDGSVCDAAHHPLADIDVRLDAHDAAGTPVRRNARTGADGHFRFEHLSPCTGTLRASSLRHVPFEQGLTLLGGQEARPELVLAPLPIAGAIRVAVESESGSYEPAFSLRLTLENDLNAAAGGERFERHVPGKWSLENGRRVARFEFADLPEQGYRLQVEKDDFFSWDPLRLSVRPPADDVRIRIADGVPNAGYVFRLRDADTGETLPAFGLTLEFPGSRMTPRRLDGHSDAIFLGHVPLDRPLLWRLDCGGHAPAIGTQAAFQVVETRGASEVRVCELELRAGWGEYYQFLDARNRNALPGVHVLLDGNDAGTSDARGCVLVRARTQPQNIEFTRPGQGIEAPRPLRTGKRNGRAFEVLVAQPPPRKPPPKGNR